MPEEVSKLLLHLETTPKAVSQNAGVIARSPDAYNIRKIFHRLTEAKDDEQQRSWALYEDESMIVENLEHLYAILVCSPKCLLFNGRRQVFIEELFVFSLRATRTPRSQST